MRLILYTGKGGVGKTTISAITGVKASLLNHRTLVISTDIAHSLSDVFDIELGSEPVPVAKNLWAQEINVLEEIKTHWNEVHDYLTNLLVTKGLDDVVAEEISVLPGMEELCGLLQINKQYKSDLFDCIIVDCAPTGESLRFLSLLDTVDWYVEKLFDISSKVTGIFQPIVKTALVLPNEKIFEAVEGLFGQLRELRKLLANVENTSLRIVLNPQKMVIKEAQRSFTYFNLFNYNTDGIIINKIQTHPLSEEGNEIQEKYLKEIAPALKEKLNISNVMEIPKIEKVVLNMWIWTYVRTGNKDFSSLQEHLTLIAGQACTVRYAKKAISNFKLRAWMPVWLSVTLRWEKMYDFLDKLIHAVLPRVRDFRGINKNGFDIQGNYNFWIKEHSIFLEVPQDDVVKNHGIQITIKTTAKNKEAWKELLTQMWFPFSK